jgi:hypothetical protein
MDNMNNRAPGASTRSRSKPAPHMPHRGETPVRVGRYTVFLGGTMHFQPGDADRFDVLIPLTETGLPFGEMVEVDAESRIPRLPPLAPGRKYQVLPLPIIDFQPLPANFPEVLAEKVVPLLVQGKRVVAFCAGSHGRTGTFLAQLIAILERRVKDPIRVARARHCRHAVETADQARSVFAIKGTEVPGHYHFHG